MKRKNFLILILVGVFMLNFMSGCQVKRKTIIYESGSDLVVVYSDDTKDQTVNAFVNELNSIRGELAKIRKDDSLQGSFEIVIGDTSREISKKAYKQLAKVKKKNNEYISYLFYCEKNSLAIAYEKSQFNVDFAMDKALNRFLSNYAVGGQYSFGGVMSALIVEVVLTFIFLSVTFKITNTKMNVNTTSTIKADITPPNEY